jgi:hypothetical protein
VFTGEGTKKKSFGTSKKVYPKFDAVEMEAANKVQLLDAFSPDSIRCFPRNSRAVVGVTTCREVATIFKIRFLGDHPTLTMHRSYDLQATTAVV